MRFNAEKYRRDKRYGKLLPSNHLAVLDGREVVDERIDYEADGESWYIYPVNPEWCDFASDESEGVTHDR